MSDTALLIPVEGEDTLIDSDNDLGFENRAFNGQPRIKYSLEELMAIGESPLSHRRPECYDDTPPSGGAVRIPWKRPAEPQRTDDDKLSRLDKRRERVRKFQEIVLSPQRRSFNMGCHMPPPPPTAQPAVPLVPPVVRDRRIGSGRILARDVSWDYKPLENADDTFPYRNGAPTGFIPGARDSREGRDGRGDRDGLCTDWVNERRPFGRGTFEGSRGRGGTIRRGFRDYEAEPEWFSSGPTSQFDTIELRGFEETAPTPESPSETKGSTQPPSQSQPQSQPQQPQPQSQQSKTEEPEEPRSTTPDTNNNAQDKEVGSSREFNLDDYFSADFFNEQSQPADGAASRFSQWFTRRSPEMSQVKDDLDSRRSSIIDELENILNDSLSPDPSDGNSNKYFAPISPANGGGGAIGGEVSKSVMDFLHTANVPTPGQAGMPSAVAPKHTPHQKILNVKEIEASMRECGLEPLSVRTGRSVRFGGGGSQMAPTKGGGGSTIGEKKVEMEAFRKFVANMPNEQLVGGQQQQQQQQQAAAVKGVAIEDKSTKGKGAGGVFVMGNRVGAGAGVPRASASTYLDLVQKVIYYGSTQTNRQELLNTPEARQFLRGLLRGELSIPNLLGHLRVAPPGREQEIIVAVLWHFDKTSRAEVAAQLLQPLTQQNRPPPPLIQPPAHSPSLDLPPPPPHMIYPPAAAASGGGVAGAPSGGQQKLSVSPLPNAMPQRIPSPRELQFHTQSIMQNALIRKKLEEQLENYRKRQEIAQQNGGGGGGGGGGGAGSSMPSAVDGQLSPARRIKPQHQAAPSPTPLAFTPTSVLRKMTADKDMEPLPKDPNRMSGQMAAGAASTPKGRAIVKGGQQMVYASSIEMQQIQQYQQQAQQQRPRLQIPPQHQQQNQAPPPQVAPPQINPAAGAAFANFAQQHFMQQRHQRPQRHQLEAAHFAQQLRAAQRPPSSGVDGRPMLNFTRDGNMSPTSNQLARWFSPELLAQASAGKLPSLGVGQALSLEEFERSMQHSSTTVHN